MSQLLDGHKAAEKIYQEIEETLLRIAHRKPPTLATVLTTDNPASHSYVSRKVLACKKHGFRSEQHRIVPKDDKELLTLIDELNKDDEIDGILVQLPLPPHIDEQKILEHIAPEKDVDGFHPLNAGRTLIDDKDAFCPCTPIGIHSLLQANNISIEGKHVVIIGRSHIVGRPLASLFLQNRPECNATVTVCHRHTRNLKELTLQADILIAAIGRPHFITKDMVKEGSVVVDVGINRIEDKNTKSGFRVVGDVDFENVKDKCYAISPVPGGVGPMTIASLLQNTLKSFLRRRKL